MAKDKLKILEKNIRKQVIDYLKIKGYFVFYNLAGLGAYPGISDLVACKDDRVWFIEIKTAKGKQSDHQKAFETNLKKAGCNYLLVRGIEDLVKEKL